MIIDKAIEIIKELPENVNNILDYDQQDALKIDIEALYRLLWLRSMNSQIGISKLASETKE